MHSRQGGLWNDREAKISTRHAETSKVQKLHFQFESGNGLDLYLWITFFQFPLNPVSIPHHVDPLNLATFSFPKPDIMELKQQFHSERLV